MRDKTSRAKTVENILFGTFTGNAATRYGIANEYANCVCHSLFVSLTFTLNCTYYIKKYCYIIKHIIYLGTYTIIRHGYHNLNS